jgi:hypothetical protein
MIKEQDSEEPGESPVDEDAISELQGMVGECIPEDFTKMNLKVPTQAEDGESVTVILTGTAKGGYVQDVYGAEMTPKPETPKSRLGDTLRGKQEE